jgi:tripartite ATP-independent transporter DctM subunit
MIVYAVLAEESVGRMFLAGVGPGLLLAAMFSATILLMARFRPSAVFEAEDAAPAPVSLGARAYAAKTLPILILVTLVLGGLYGGFFNPTEAGALGARVIALLRRSLTRRGFWDLLVEAGQITVSVLILIMAATFFSRMMTLSGVPRLLADLLLDGLLGPYGFLVAFIALVIVLGFIIDSISIMLILLPIALPVAEAAGFDLIWFGVMTVLAVEIGLLTPPFGLSVYTIRSALAEEGVQVGEIFRGAFPFVLTMIAALVVLTLFPSIATWLARL